MAKKTRKTGKRAATKKSAKKSTQQRSPARKKSGGAKKKKAAARKPVHAKTSGSGLVYTDPLREALAQRRG